MIDNFLEIEYENISFYYDTKGEKMWIDRPNLSKLTNIKNVTISKLLSNYLLEGVIDNRINIKIKQKINYKTIYVYDNKILRILLNNDIEFKKILLFQKEYINDIKIKKLGKIYLNNGNLELNNLLLSENNITFSKSDLEKLFLTDIPIGKETYNLYDVFNLAYIIDNKNSNEIRYWINNILNKALIDGYYINNEKCFNEKTKIIDITSIADGLLNKEYILDDDKHLYYKSKIKFNKDLYDSKTFINDILISAKEKVILYSKYIDDSSIDIFDIVNPRVVIHTSKDSEMTNIALKTFRKSHRLKISYDYNLDETYLIIDNTTYLIDISFINILKENSRWSIFNIKHEGFLTNTK